MELFAPNEKEIVEILLSDGSKSEFSFTTKQSGIDKVFSYTLPTSRSSDPLKRDGDMVLVDEDGKEWLANDVEYHNSISTNDNLQSQRLETASNGLEKRAIRALAVQVLAAL